MILPFWKKKKHHERNDKPHHAKTLLDDLVEARIEAARQRNGIQAEEMQKDFYPEEH